MTQTFLKLQSWEGVASLLAALAFCVLGVLPRDLQLSQATIMKLGLWFCFAALPPALAISAIRRGSSANRIAGGIALALYLIMLLTFLTVPHKG